MCVALRKKHPVQLVHPLHSTAHIRVATYQVDLQQFVWLSDNQLSPAVELERQPLPAGGSEQAEVAAYDVLGPHHSLSAAENWKEKWAYFCLLGRWD